MSYSKVKSFSFSKDFKTVKINRADGRTFPIYYYKNIYSYEDYKDRYDSVFAWVKRWFEDFIDGVLQFNNKKNYIDFVINKTLEDIKKTYNDLYVSVYNYKTIYNDSKQEYIFIKESEKKEYDNKIKIRDNIYNKIINNFITHKYKKEYNNLKKEKYYLTNGYNYIISNGKKSFKYSGLTLFNGEKNQSIKIFNGLDKIVLKNYFAITQYGYEFKKVEEV